MGRRMANFLVGANLTEQIFVLETKWGAYLESRSALRR